MDDLIYYHSRVYLGSHNRKDAIFEWINKNCPSYICCFCKAIDPEKPHGLDNYDIDLYFKDKNEALLCQLRWA